MDAVTIDTITKVVNTVGFPIVVAVWFMWRSDKRQDKLIGLVQELLALEKAKREKKE